MVSLNKLRLLLFISLILVIIFRIIIPGYYEKKRQDLVGINDVDQYEKNSVDIEIEKFQILSETSEVYYDGTPFIKKYSTKEITYLKNLSNNNIYKIELYYPSALILIGQKNRILTLSINKIEAKGKGSLENPIICLRYSSSSDINEYVTNENYRYNIREYLTYKDYKTPAKNLMYYITMIWVFLSIFGFAIITGVLNKKMHRIEQEKIKTNESLNKDLD